VPFVPLGVHFWVPASEGLLWLGSLLDPWVRKGDLPVTTLLPHPGPQFCLDVSAESNVLLCRWLPFSDLFGTRHGSGAGIRSPDFTAFAPMRAPPGNTPRAKKRLLLETSEQNLPARGRTPGGPRKVPLGHRGSSPGNLCFRRPCSRRPLDPLRHPFCSDVLAKRSLFHEAMTIFSRCLR
jgi:hypothetical protein